MHSFSFGCATRVAAKRGRTAAQPHGRTAAPHVCMAARRHGAPPNGGTTRRHARQGDTAALHDAPLHGGTAVRPHCENCGRARATNETEPARIVAASAAAAGRSTHASASPRPLSRSRARTAAARPRATERRWQRHSVHKPPLPPARSAGSTSTVRAARSLRTPAAGPHRGPLLRLSLLRPKRDGARSNRRCVGGSGQRQYTRLRFLPTATPAARKHSGRPPARYRAALAAAVHTRLRFPPPAQLGQPARSAVGARRGAERTAQPARTARTVGPPERGAPTAVDWVKKPSFHALSTTSFIRLLTPAKETGIVLMRCIIAKALYGRQNIGFGGPPTE